MLEVSSGDISSLNLSGISLNQNDIEELKIINDTVENLEICKNYYADIYANVSGCFQHYLRSAPDVLIEKMQDDLKLNLYSYIHLKNLIPPSELYKRFKSGNTRGLVCVHFLAPLYVHLGGDKMISKSTMSEFFHNLSMQALSKSDDTIVIKFDAIKRLNKSLNDLLTAESLAFDTARISRMTTRFFDPPIFITGEQTDIKKLRKKISEVF